MNNKDIQGHLVRIGWPLEVDGIMGPITKQAIKDFQHGYTFMELEVDGIAGPLTQAALVDCIDNHDKRCGEFFRFSEFASKGNGWIRVHPRLLNRLDAARRAHGPIRINSGYRDPDHNRSVGGATNSQHLYGTAADIPGIPYGLAVKVGFSGIGLPGPGGIAIHVDVRGEGPNNTTGGAPGTPTVWYY